MAVFAQVVGFEQCLARLDGMFDGLHNVFLGSLVFAQRLLGEPVRGLRELGRIDRRFGSHLPMNGWRYCTRTKWVIESRQRIRQKHGKIRENHCRLPRLPKALR